MATVRLSLCPSLPSSLCACRLWFSVCLRLRLRLRLCLCLSMCLRPCVSVPASDCGISAKNTEENVLTTWVLAHIVLEVVNLSATQDGIHAAQLCESPDLAALQVVLKSRRNAPIILTANATGQNLSEAAAKYEFPYLASLRELQALLKRTT